jgi:hypothetical protein
LCDNVDAEEIEADDQTHDAGYPIPASQPDRAQRNPDRNIGVTSRMVRMPSSGCTAFASAPSVLAGLDLAFHRCSSLPLSQWLIQRSCDNSWIIPRLIT